MNTKNKMKKRGFVMTGGGAKGLYEAGVIHAFHITGMEFDVITGSSIGAMNSVFFAEYLFRKLDLPPEVRTDPEKAVEAMDRMVRQFHHAWLLLPAIKIIDDGESGPLGMLVNDLMKFNLSLPQITRLGWWWSDPKKGIIPSPEVAAAGGKLVKELIERLGGLGELLRIIRDHRQEILREALRTYLERFGMDQSLVPGKDDRKLKDAFTAPVTPLTSDHLVGEVVDTPAEDESGLINPERSMGDYYQAGIDVRLTRANYRTGRLEISGYLSPTDFIRWLERQAWRLQSGDPDQIPLGSFRLQMLGNANAVNSGLASGRFPGVFAPYPIADLYLNNDPENSPLHDMLTNWMDGNIIQEALRDAYFELHAGEEGVEASWKTNFESWRDSEVMASFFANDKDTYVDGGAIDNTPSNSVVDATREWVDKEDISKQNVILDNLNVNTINYFGKQGADLGQALLALLEALESGGDSEHLEGLEEAVQEAARQRGLRGFLGSNPAGILERLEKWGQERISRRLPLQVNQITIHPEEMPMSTLQFTERLGYRKENAIEMLTMGCYNTLWTLVTYLEEGSKHFDDQDRIVLDLVRKWTGIDEVPEDNLARNDLQKSWHCRRTACVYHAKHCPRGKKGKA
jgi:predicted acylesterase/phospholipase RssA